MRGGPVEASGLTIALAGAVTAHLQSQGLRLDPDLAAEGDLAVRGLGGVPQTVLGLFADTIRNTLGVPPEMKLLFGVSFGYPDLEASGNRTRMGRDPVAANVTFHD